MTTPGMNDLRTSLHDVADHVPRADVPVHDLWQQGRAVRRGERATALAAVVVLVLLVAGVGAVVNPVTGVMPAGTPEVPDGGALPTEVYAPTLPAAGWTPGVGALEEDLAFGPVSVARMHETGVPVLVVAVDGTHHLPDLPRTSASHETGQATVSLSPDGALLAYDWRTDDSQPLRTRSGLAVLDLRTGDVETYDVVGDSDPPVTFEQISWSADGSHVAWLGDADHSESASANGNSRLLTAGVLRLDDREMRTWTLAQGARPRSAVAVSETGNVFLLARHMLWTSPFHGATNDDEPTLVGRRVLDFRGSWTTATVADGILYAGESAGPGGLVSIDVDDPEARAEPVEWPRLGPSDWLDPVGTTPEGAVVAVVHKDDMTAVASTIERLESGRVRVLTELPGGAFQTVGVATWLADADPVEFPAPRWPMSDERKAVLVVLGVSALGVAAFLVRLVLLRRRQAPH